MSGPGGEPTEAVEALTTIPNVGPATAGDLVRVGVEHPRDLAGCDPDRLFERLCSVDGRDHDPCTRDVFAAAVAYVDEGVERPWWHFSRERKAGEADGAASDFRHSED